MVLVAAAAAAALMVAVGAEAAMESACADPAAADNDEIDDMVAAAPGPAAALCSVGCEHEFIDGCMGYWAGALGGSAAAAYARCRAVVDDGAPDAPDPHCAWRQCVTLAGAGCVPGCAPTPAMSLAGGASTCSIDRIAGISDELFEASYWGRRPVVLSGVSDNAAARKKWTKRFLSAKYGSIELQANKPAALGLAGQGTGTGVSIRSYLRTLSGGAKSNTKPVSGDPNERWASKVVYNIAPTDHSIVVLNCGIVAAVCTRAAVAFGVSLVQVVPVRPR
eukprot:SAG22_NODE_62_length_23371_cov_84.500602_4_plen_278_part_00